MVKYKGKVTKAEIIRGEVDQPIEIWATFDINGYEIEAFLGLPPVDPERGKAYTVDLKIMTYDLEIVDVPKKQKLMYQITTNPDYIFVGEVLEIDHEKKRLIFDCGLKLECDTEGVYIEPEAKKLRKGDWVFIKGKMFGDIEEFIFFKNSMS